MGTTRRLREVPSPLLLVPSTLLNDMTTKMVLHEIKKIDVMYKKDGAIENAQKERPI